MRNHAQRPFTAERQAIRLTLAAAAAAALLATPAPAQAQRPALGFTVVEDARIDPNRLRIGAYYRLGEQTEVLVSTGRDAPTAGDPTRIGERSTVAPAGTVIRIERAGVESGVRDDLYAVRTYGAGGTVGGYGFVDPADLIGQDLAEVAPR